MPTDQAANPFSQLVPFALIFVIFYFLVFKPEKDKRKKLKDMISNLKKNDEVITVGGIHGTVSLVKDNTVVLRVDDNVKIEFDKESITTVLAPKNS